MGEAALVAESVKEAQCSWDKHPQRFRARRLRQLLQPTSFIVKVDLRPESRVVALKTLPQYSDECLAELSGARAARVIVRAHLRLLELRVELRQPATQRRGNA